MTIRGICISAHAKHEFEQVKKMILDVSPSLKIINFYDVLKDITLLDKCDCIFTVGGDGSVAWLIQTFFEAFGNVKKLKPIVPVIRPESIGYLKQLDFEEAKFISGMEQIIDGHFTIQDRTILKTEISGHPYVAVNEIFLYSAPQLGKFTVYIKHDNSHYDHMTTTMADGVMVVTPIGSTGWALSYRGQISLNEESLGLVFAGGIHSSADFTLPRRPIKLTLDLKNSSITEDTITAYEKTRQKLGLSEDQSPPDTLAIVYGPRVLIDGKVVSFDTNEIEIDSSFSIPFVILHQETVVDKVRKLTQQPSVK
ncbi:MAG: hypothetical protein ACXAD7_24745 [Candidatus Kariarchaeaceae archaeon]|jgi:hypothetical protein